MKKLIFVMLFAAAACEPDPKPADQKLEGHWEFTATNVSGDFRIEDNDIGNPAVKSGMFVINGHTSEIDFQAEINVNYDWSNALDLIFLDNDGDTFEFTNETYTEDFQEIHAEGFSYIDGSSHVTVVEPVVITRK
jgi:hypothetical protein